MNKRKIGQCDMDELHSTFGGDGPFCQVTIKDKQHCLFLSPFVGGGATVGFYSRAELDDNP